MSVPSGMELFVIVVVLLIVWNFVDVIRSNLSSSKKIFWIIMLLLFGFFTSIIWLIKRKSYVDKITAMSEKFCAKCGTKNKSDDKFCQQCGNELI